MIISIKYYFVSKRYLHECKESKESCFLLLELKIKQFSKPNFFLTLSLKERILVSTFTEIECTGEIKGKC